jgi:hypothetical protein
MAARYMVVQSGDVAWTGSIWAATATGSAGSAATPASGDDVYILSGTANITSGLAQSAVVLNSLTIGFNGTIGTSATSLAIGMGTSKTIHVSGQASINIAPDDSGNGSAMQIYDNYTGSCKITGGALSGGIVCGRNGSCSVSAGTFPDITSCGCALLLSGSASITNITIYGGNHNSQVSATTLGMYGACAFTQTGPSATVAAISLRGPSTYIHDTGGNITGLFAFPSSRAITTGNYGGFTVTALALWIGADVFSSPSVPVTVTTTTKYGFR